jgi:predicted Fe-Mo cluster-binding NifX family protein
MCRVLPVFRAGKPLFEEDATMELIVACATDDRRTLTSEHFGSARTYAICKLDETACTFLQSLTNTVKTGEETHADPQKARSVTELLADRGVLVLVAKRFGPNIGRIKQSFVPVIVKTNTLEDGCQKLVENREAILAELHQGEGRGFLLLS